MFQSVLKTTLKFGIILRVSLLTLFLCLFSIQIYASDISLPTGTISINNNAAYANSAYVILTLSAYDSGGSVSQMQFSNDNTNWSTPEPYAAAKSWTLLEGNGIKTVYAKFKDEAGNWSKPVKDTISLDTTTPVGSITINNGPYTSSTFVILTLSAFDPAGSVLEMQFSNDNINWSAPEHYAITKFWLISSSGGPIKTVFVRFKDAADNWSAPFSNTIILDTTPPVLPVVTGSATSSDTQLSASWSSSDPESAIALYEYRITQGSNNGTVIKDWTDNGTSSSVTANGLSLESGKIYFFAVRAKNRAGLYSDIGYSNGLVIIPPSDAISINNGQAYTNSVLVNLSLSASNAGGKVSRMQFSNDNKNWSDPETFASGKSWKLLDGDGEKKVYVKYLNSAGQWSNPVSAGIIVDSIAPITADSGIDGLWHNSPETVTLKASDISSSIGGAAAADDYTKLLLHGDGDNGSTIFKDETGKSITANGNVHIDTAKYKLGTGSVYLDGNGSYLSAADAEDWNFGTGDLTLDLWVMFNSVSSAQCAISQVEDDTHKWALFWVPNSGWEFYNYNNGYTVDIWEKTYTAPSTGVWYHIALVRSGNNFQLYRDGVNIASAVSTGSLPNYSGVLNIGRTSSGGFYTRYFNGWLDEVRISKGLARWTSNFTPLAASGSGVSITYYSLDGSTPNLIYSNPLSLAQEGTYNIKYYSQDKAGNAELVKTSSNLIKIDRTPPTGSIVINGGAASADNPNVALTLSANDAVSGMGEGAQMQFSNDNKSWSSPESYTTTKSWRLSSSSGARTVFVKFKDAAGNWSESLSSNIAVVDSPNKERIYIYANGRRIAMEENGQKYFFHSDHLGGTNVVSDETGQQVEYVDYKPYGETKTEEGSLEVKKKFTGKELDDSTGLYDYGARMYDPKTGRFISADTAAPRPENPQSLNRYSYALNNPLKYVDPSGHNPLAIALFIPGAQEVAALVVGYLVLKWAFERLDTSIHNSPYISLDFRLPGFSQEAPQSRSVESPSPPDIEYQPEGMEYTEMPGNGVLNTKTYRHYGYEKDADSLKEGLKPGAYATHSRGRPMKGSTAEQKLSLEHDSPPDSYYKVRPKENTPVYGPTEVDPIPGRTGGGEQYKFPKGTGKDTVTGPFKIEP